MMRFLGVFLAVLLLASVNPAPAAEAAPGDVELAFAQMLEATIENNYAKFVQSANSTIKASLSAQALADVSRRLKPRAEKGYRVEYLGFFQTQGHTNYLWKLIFEDGGDDVLAEMSRKDGLTSGFYLK